MTNNDKLFIILYQLCHILSEQRERRVCHHNICLFQQFDAFSGAEVAITLQVVDSNLVRVGDTVAVVVASILQPDSPLRIVLAEQVTLLK